jgi:hypothetical protein
MIEKLIEKLKSDSDYRYSWQANIAVAYQDAYHWHKEKTGKEPSKDDIHEISNIAANHFLDLLCMDTAETSYNKDCAVASPAETSPKSDKSDFAQS